MNKKLIRLTESDLRRIVKESVNRVLNEIGDTPKGQYMLGRLQARQLNKGKNKSAAETAIYAGKEENKIHPKEFPPYENDLSHANLLGYADESDGGNIDNTNWFLYNDKSRKFRDTHLNGISKF